MPEFPEQTVDLQFRAVVVKAERNGQVGVFRAIVPDQSGQIVLDLSSIMPADKVRQVQIDDYAEISIRIRKKEIVDAELTAATKELTAEERAAEEFIAEVPPPKTKRERHLRAA